MTNIEVFEKVAARKLSPEAGAKLLLKADQEKRAARRPPWTPGWLWVLGGALVAFCLAVVGIQRDAWSPPARRWSARGRAVSARGSRCEPRGTCRDNCADLT
jgi:hypothetical protein